MAHFDPAPLTFARAAAVVGLGTAFGFQSSISLWSMPIFFKVPTLSARDRLHLWSELFDRGMYTMVPLNGFSGLVLAGCAYLAKPGSNYVAISLVGKHRQAILATAALCSLSILGFTRVAIFPTVNKLKNAEAMINKEPEIDAAKLQTDEDMRKWTSLHLVRVALCGVAAVLATTELALA